VLQVRSTATWLKRAAQVPKTYLPVVQAMINELGGLGFISTAVFVLTHPGGQLFSKMCVQSPYLGPSRPDRILRICSIWYQGPG